MLEIRSKEVNGRVYESIDLRQLPVGEEATVTLAYDKPKEIVGKWGPVKSFTMFYNGKLVSSLIPNSCRSPDLSVSFPVYLGKFKKGDVLKISRKESMNDFQRKVHYFNCFKVGTENLTTQTTYNTPPTPQATPAKKFNLEVPSNPGNNILLSSDEQELVNQIKKTHPEYNKEQVVHVLVQNEIPVERAKLIATSSF